MKKLLIITDSLGLPRKVPEVTYWEDTYAYLLSKDYIVYQYSVGFARIQDLHISSYYLTQFQPDIVILQCGIVDCAPRAYKWIEERIFENYRIGKLIRKILSKTISTRKLRSKRRVVYTSEGSFFAHCYGIKNDYPNAKVYAVSIISPCEEFERVNPGVTANVKRYNAILKDVFEDNLIDVTDIPDDGVMTDFHHLNAKGHRWVYDRIQEYLMKSQES